MPKQGEIDYLKNIGAAGARHAFDKPFSDADCGTFLMEMGAVLHLVPPPPARVLDLGCGTGWTSCFLARRGYQVVGQDIAADMIDHAHANKERYRVANLSFVVGDYEDMPFDAEFDAALFFDSLHHSISEEDALRTAYRALKPGGVCITSEPGVGHARRPFSREVVERYHVTERDMGPGRIIRAARKVGFRHFRVYPHLKPISDLVFGVGHRKLFRMFRWLPGFVRAMLLVFIVLIYKRFSGIVVLSK